jgi:hypothetical protein
MTSKTSSVKRLLFARVYTAKTCQFPCERALALVPNFMFMCTVAKEPLTKSV